jgi:hypothetical protein
MVAALIRTSWSAAQRSQCSASVASGWAATWAAKAGHWSRPIRGGRPGFGVGARVPAACRRRQRLIVLRPTPNNRLACAWGRPASMARSKRSRRSTEYVFMAQPSDAGHFIRNLL